MYEQQRCIAAPWQVPENSGKLTFHNPHPQSEVLAPLVKKNQSIHLAPRVGWQPKVKFNELVEIMVENDMKLFANN